MFDNAMRAVTRSMELRQRVCDATPHQPRGFLVINLIDVNGLDLAGTGVAQPLPISRLFQHENMRFLGLAELDHAFGPGWYQDQHEAPYQYALERDQSLKAPVLFVYSPEDIALLLAPPGPGPQKQRSKGAMVPCAFCNYGRPCPDSDPRVNQIFYREHEGKIMRNPNGTLMLSEQVESALENPMDIGGESGPKGKERYEEVCARQGQCPNFGKLMAYFAKKKERSPPKLFRCALCNTIKYCSKDCQTLDWSVHKPICLAARPKVVGKK